MNGFGTNVKKEEKTGMIAYFNFALSDEEITTTRQKYTWLDSFGLVGGFIDTILILITVFFFFYNYDVNHYMIYYLSEKERLQEEGKELS